jgi:hypothetical protein
LPDSVQRQNADLIVNNIHESSGAEADFVDAGRKWTHQIGTIAVRIPLKLHACFLVDCNNDDIWNYRTALPAQRGVIGEAIQRSGSPALGRKNRLHWRLDVVVNEDQDRRRMGTQRNAERRIKRLLARKIQTRRMGGCLPHQTSETVLKCDCPGRQVNPLAARSALCCLTAWLNCPSGIRCKSCEKMLDIGVMADPFGSNVALDRNPLQSIEDQPCSILADKRN